MGEVEAKLSEALRDVLTSEIINSILPAVKGATDNLHEYVQKEASRRVQHSIEYFLDKRWWSKIHSESVQDIVRSEVVKLVEKRVTDEFVASLATRAIDDVGDRLTQKVEDLVVEEVLRRAFPRERSPRGKILRILRGAARTIVEAESGRV